MSDRKHLAIDLLAVRTNGALVLLGLGGAGLILLSTSLYGVGTSTDSVSYIHAAKSLLSGGGYVDFGGSPFVNWAPLFPTVLAAIGLIGIEPLDGARFVNAAAFGLTIFATGHLLLMHVRSKALAILGTAAVLISLPLLRVFIIAWSEPLFALAAVLFVIYLSKFLNEERFVLLLIAAVLAALAWLERYIGVTFVLAGIISIATVMRGSPLVDRFRYIIVFGLFSVIPAVIWMARNYSISGTFTGPREYSATEFLQNLGYSLDTLGTWLGPVDYVSLYQFKVILAALAGLIVAAVLAVLVKGKLSRKARSELLRLAPVGIFVVTYIVALIITAPLINFEKQSQRLLVPIYVFVLLFMVIGIEETLALVGRWTRRANATRLLWLAAGLLLIVVGLSCNVWVVEKLVLSGKLTQPLITAKLLAQDGGLQTAARVVVSLLGISVVLVGVFIITFRKKAWLGSVAVIGLWSIWLVYSLGQTAVYVGNRIELGAGGVNTTLWRESPLILWLPDHPLRGQVYSNQSRAIYLLSQQTRISNPRILPFESLISSPDQFSVFVDSVATPTETYLVWLGDKFRPTVQRYDFQDVATMFELEEIAKFDDGGGVYRFK